MRRRFPRLPSSPACMCIIWKPCFGFTTACPSRRTCPRRWAARANCCASRGSLRLQTIPRLEDPPDRADAQRQEHPDHGETDADADVGDLVETPAKAAYQVDH